MKIARIVLAVGALLLVSAAGAQEAADAPKAFFEKLIGSWEGTCRTWLQPDKLADESAVKGEFQFTLGGRLVRHTYAGTMLGKPRTGEETIGFSSFNKKLQLSWIDDFHTADGIFFSEGAPTPTGFEVSTEYSAGPGQPVWRWRTVYDLSDPDRLVITAYNRTPAGKEAKAVETIYTRVARNGPVLRGAKP